MAKSKKEPKTRPDHSEILPDGISLADLKANWEQASKVYQKIYQRMKILDAVDRGKLWDVVPSGIPSYQLCPDTNHVSKTKEALLASIYSTGLSADVFPRGADDIELAMNINLALEKVWEQAGISYLQLQAGERAALLNVGITQIGWDKDIIGGSANKHTKGQIIGKNINPANFMRDPAAEDLDTAAYCIYHESYHENWFKAQKNYNSTWKDYELQMKSDALFNRDLPEMLGTKDDASNQANSKYHKLIIHYVKTVDEDYTEHLHEIHTIDNNFVLFHKEILPAIFPFAELFCNLPVKDPVGVSPCAKIFPNSLIYNLLNSMVATQGYKAMKPPRFVNGQSGLNVYSFAKYGNDPDKVFVVNGDARTAVHYQEFPAMPQQTVQMMQTLPMDIQAISGVDEQYTGRDTGSVITTGGMVELMSRVTMLDAPKIATYENYCKRLTRLVLENLIEYGDDREYIVKDKMTGQLKYVKVDFPKVSKKVYFDYAIDISQELPRNKARRAEMANTMMEKQMQYGMEPAIITPEEWLMMQDLPNKDYMVQRMKQIRLKDTAKDLAISLAGMDYDIKQGVPVENAIQNQAGNLVEQYNPILEGVGIPDQMPENPNIPFDQQETEPITPPSGMVPMS